MSDDEAAVSNTKPRPPTAADGDSLKRRVRQLELNHRSWREYVDKDVRRQRVELDTLKRDNEQLKQKMNELRVSEATTLEASSTHPLRGGARAKKSKEIDAKREMVTSLEVKLHREEQRHGDLEEELAACRAVVDSAGPRSVVSTQPKRFMG